MDIKASKRGRAWDQPIRGLPVTISRADFLDRGTDQRFRERIYGMVLGLQVLMACRHRFGRLVGLTGSQFAVVMGIAYCQGQHGVTIRDLSTHVRLAQPHTTKEVNSLLRRGLLKKQPDSMDGRSVLVSLSASGRALLDELAPTVKATNDALFSSVSLKDLKAVTRVMRKLMLNSEYAFAELRRAELLPLTSDRDGLHRGSDEVNSTVNSLTR